MPLLIDTSWLSPVGKRVLDPASPQVIRDMAARAIVPGARPDELVTLVALLATGAYGAVASTAQLTLSNLPTPVLDGALAGDLEPGVIDQLVAAYRDQVEIMARLLAMPRIDLSTVIDAASRATELVSELIATNEQRLLQAPEIIERLYMNRATRMSTADRVIELAVRHGLELTNIPAFEQIAAAIAGELIAEATAEASPDDVAFVETMALGERLAIDPTVEDAVEIDDEGKEAVIEKLKPLYARLGGLTIAQRIRIATLGSSAERALLLRDANRLVCQAAIRSPLIQEPEVVRISASRVVADDVLRVVGMNKEWLRNYQIKLNLVTNPRAPLFVTSRLVSHLRESDIRSISKSKNVPGPIVKMAKQQLERRKT